MYTLIVVWSRSGLVSTYSDLSLTNAINGAGLAKRMDPFAQTSIAVAI